MWWLALACSGASAPQPPIFATEVSLHHGAAGDTLPMVVVVHGFGATPESILDLFDGYPGPLRVVAPAGPGTYGDGRAWFDVEGVTEQFPGGAAEEFRARGEEFDRYLQQLTALYPTAGRPVVTGFSQGGMVSYLAAARSPKRISGAVPIAGMLTPGLVEGGLSGVRVRALHGEADQRVAFAEGVEAVNDLAAHGADATMTPFPGVDHTVTRAMRDALWAHVAEMVR